MRQFRQQRAQQNANTESPDSAGLLIDEKV
jgi:hypothetical protein